MPEKAWWEGLDRERPWLVGLVLALSRWTRPVGDAWYDHDHCGFCFAEFSDTEPNALREGYTTPDNAQWICADCFNIPGLRELFRLTLAK